MTALVFIIQPHQVCLAMDTLVVGADDRMPLFFQRKFLSSPESNLVIAGTGHAGFINGWFQHLQAHLQGATIDDLNAEATKIFRASVSAEGGLSGLTATIYHFGYSVAERKYIGFAYRSTADFQSERLPYDCLGIKPEIKVELPDSLVVPSLFVDLMTQQQLADQTLPINQQVGIGGEVEFVVLRDQHIHIETAYRFESYADEAQYIESRGRISQQAILRSNPRNPLTSMFGGSMKPIITPPSPKYSLPSLNDTRTKFRIRNPESGSWDKEK